MWDFFEQITSKMPRPVCRNDQATWPTLLDLYPSHGMLFQHWGVGHADFAWWVRQQPAVYDVFSKLWNTPPEELLVSFDGASFQAPPDRPDNPAPRRGWGSAEPWFHADQSLLRPEHECVQAWVTALDVARGDATLCVLAKSHVLHGEMARAFPALVGRRDWVRYGDECVQFLKQRGCEEVRIECPAGSMVLWDSRTAHYGAPPLRTRAVPSFRAVVYVCYLPRSRSTPGDRKKKRDAFDHWRTTSHWPNRATLFQPEPNTYGKPLPSVAPPSDPHVSALGKKMAGF